MYGKPEVELVRRLLGARQRFGLGVGSPAISPYFRLKTHEAARLIDGLVSVDLGQIERARLARGRFPMIEGIQAGRIRYRRADPREHWKSWDEVMRDGWGDCEDLASGVAAELRYSGIPARTYVYRSGPKLYHVVVHTPRWGLLDPSRAAGMGGNG
jgi:hypothetical protein